MGTGIQVGLSCVRLISIIMMWIVSFVCSKFDLYSKADGLPEVEDLKDYYQKLIDKYIPGELCWWSWLTSQPLPGVHALQVISLFIIISSHSPVYFLYKVMILYLLQLLYQFSSNNHTISFCYKSIVVCNNNDNHYWISFGIKVATGKS